MPEAAGEQARPDLDPGGANSERLRSGHVPDRGIGSAETILYCWALTAAERDTLETEGWNEVARHPVHQGSALMRFHGSSGGQGAAYSAQRTEWKTSQ